MNHYHTLFIICVVLLIKELDLIEEEGIEFNPSDILVVRKLPNIFRGELLGYLTREGYSLLLIYIKVKTLICSTQIGTNRVEKLGSSIRRTAT